MQKSINDYGLLIYNTEENIGYMINVDENMKCDTENKTGLSKDSEEAAKALFNKLQSEVDEQYQLMKIEFAL